jgi:hypothetical protein
MRIVKAGQLLFARSIELSGACILKLIRRPRPLNDAITNRNCTIGNNAEFSELMASAGTRRTGYSNELPRVNDI